MTGMEPRAAQDLPRLILIADRPTCGERVIMNVLEKIAPHVPPGSLMVIDRDSSASTLNSTIRSRLKRLSAMQRLLNEVDAWLIVSGRPDLALLSGAHGVQLPEHGLDTLTVKKHFPHLLVGRSCHDRRGLCQAQNEGADWALLSPVAAPFSNTITTPLLGLTGFSESIQGLKIPVFGLGGMTPTLTLALMDRGAAGIATLGGVFLSSEPVKRLVQYLNGVCRFDIPG